MSEHLCSWVVVNHGSGSGKYFVQISMRLNVVV